MAQMTTLTTLQRKQLIDFMKEHPEEVVELFQEILQRSKKNEIVETSKEEFWNKKIIQLMNRIQVPISSKGYGYLREAILNGIMIYPEVKQMGEVYHEIANKHFVNYCSVERALRFVKEETWKDGTIRKEISSFYHCTKLPTNTIFIRKLVEDLIKNNE